MPVNLCQTDDTQQHHRARSQHWRRASQRFPEKGPSACLWIGFAFELHVTTVVQPDSDDPEKNERHHGDADGNDRGARRRSRMPDPKRHSRTACEKRNPLRRTLDMAQQHQLGTSTEDAAGKSGQQDPAYDYEGRRLSHRIR